jgi:hypothetical protein
MSPVDALLLFHSFGDDVQRRIIVPIERVKHFNFKPITDYIQKGLQLEPKELFGTEFEVNALGDLVGEKREGKNPMVWVLDITNRGRKGDQGAKGARGEKGRDGDAGKSFLEQLASAKVNTTINPEATQEEKMSQLFSLLLVKCARDKLSGRDIRGEAIAKREHEWNMKAIRGEPQ